ncbi:hypothetical protein [Burkholderia gladioli]|uniref:hypothetical protein n=1 Tax=Burkholderia gladioli TaxID=28095 RepID=UPI00163F3287|nr:hypothetical protein [Burkholderia gladioli]
MSKKTPRKIISRDSARAEGLARFFTGKPCRNGHKAERFVSNGRCVQCSVSNARKHYEANRSQILAGKKDYYRENRDTVIQRSNDYRVRQRAARDNEGGGNAVAN